VFSQKSHQPRNRRRVVAATAMGSRVLSPNR
jgi:hypothetical protein